MKTMLIEKQPPVTLLTLNRPEVHNAFDPSMIASWQQSLDQCAQDPESSLLLIKAQGQHFCAGADLHWMQQAIHASKEDNIRDAQQFAQLLQTLHNFPKPTLGLIQGKTYGGGLGLIACMDIALASSEAQFCFSEIKLGLVPAMISPYVIKAIGEKNARRYFFTGETFDAKTAKALGLITDIVSPDKLEAHGLQLAQHMSQYPRTSLQAMKALFNQIGTPSPGNMLNQRLASLLAEVRSSDAAQRAMKAFFHRDAP